MPTFDPYLVLGLTRAAGPSAIKSAYRRLAQVAHPDRGGQSEDFVVLVRAFGVLSDPELKRLFDETGIIDDDAVRQFRKDLATILADMFDTAVKMAASLALPLESVNFVEQMTTAVRTALLDANRSRIQLEGDIAKLGALRTRIRRQDERPNIFADRLTAQVEGKSSELALLRRRIALLDSAVTELGNYKDEVELISALAAK